MATKSADQLDLQALHRVRERGETLASIARSYAVDILMISRLEA